MLKPIVEQSEVAADSCRDLAAFEPRRSNDDGHERAKREKPSFVCEIPRRAPCDTLRKILRRLSR